MAGIEFDILRRPWNRPWAASLFERILSIMAIVGLACLCIGLVLHISGRTSNNLPVARTGAYVLVIGIMLVIGRLIYWIMAEIVD